MLPTSSAMAVKRVVTCFILSNPDSRESLRVAVFKRQSTMPTFPSHWAGISGSMEAGEEPWQTAVRELQEETNLNPNNDSNNGGVYCEFETMGGLYLDVPFKPNRSIRVYPFVVRLQGGEGEEATLELRGTEHETHKFITADALEQLEPTVPGLATAFHQATHGRYLARSALPDSIWKWADDRVNGATTLAREAIKLAIAEELSTNQLFTMAMLRPTMVPIVNVLRVLEQRVTNGQDRKAAGQALLASIDQEVERSLQMGVESLEKIYQESQQVCTTNDNTPPPFIIATFSRSSTLLKLLGRFLETVDDSGTANLRLLCAQSTPGDEGKLMARDLQQYTDQVECVEDEFLHQEIRACKVNVVLVGSDCVLPNQFVNKIGTKALAETCRACSSCALICSADQWKLWHDDFAPPLEPIFECLPRALIDQMILPASDT